MTELRKIKNDLYQFLTALMFMTMGMLEIFHMAKYQEKGTEDRNGMGNLIAVMALKQYS